MADDAYRVTNNACWATDNTYRVYSSSTPLEARSP